MTHRVYMRDWYFNAGIVGFLSTIADNQPIEETKHIEGLAIGDNFIEFDNSVLEGFEEKFVKQAFFKFFKKNVYISRLRKNLKEIDKKKIIKPETLSKLVSDIEKSPYQNFLKLLAHPIDDVQDLNALKEKITNGIEIIDEYSEMKIFNLLNSSREGRESVLNFVRVRLKGVCSHNSVKNYIDTIQKIDYKKKVSNNTLCLSCQERKATEEFSNSISNIIGFNKDNSNWSWAYKSVNIKICPVCSLIYNCSFISFAYLLRNLQNYFYFINYNANLPQLYYAVEGFKHRLNQNSDKPLYVMIKQTVHLINLKQTDHIKRNINFIEIINNPILGGQSTKGYSVYHYNLDKDIAEFLNPILSETNRLPSGFYKIKANYFNIAEELLRMTITKQIDYSTLYHYFAMFLSGSVETAYNLNKITSFVFDYIQKIRRGNMVGEKSNTIVKKGFRSGIELRNKLLAVNKENQINGLVYGFLNDLKITDREKFLDKYIRMMMSHQMPVFFSQDEMLDTDYFLQFGYSFVNGLLYKEKEKKDDKTPTDEKEE